MFMCLLEIRTILAVAAEQDAASSSTARQAHAIDVRAQALGEGARAGGQHVDVVLLVFASHCT